MPPRRARKSAIAKKRMSAKGSLVCSDCGFKAAHPMGLGRHRSARHGAVPVRASRKRPTESAPAGWLTRQEAAKRAGVHYNTIRQWEQSNLLRTTRRPHVRGSLIAADDLARVLSERSSIGGGVGTTVASASNGDIAALNAKLDALLGGLERLVAGIRGAGGAARATASGPRRGPGRPLGSKNKPKTPVAAASAPKRRGRPPGSKNKTTSAVAAAKTGKRRGRPPGSKNKAKAPAAVAKKAKRGPGRPPKVVKRGPGRPPKAAKRGRPRARR